MLTTKVKTIHERFEDSKEVQLLRLSEFINKYDGLLYVMRQVKGE